MARKTILKSGMGLQEMMIAMSKGNPGALNALMTVTSIDWLKTDPINALAFLSPLTTLDTLGIYGEHIYYLYNDTCNREPKRMHMLLRAYQLGILDEDFMQLHSSDARPPKPDFAGIYKKVKAQIKSFYIMEFEE